ncbi:MAG: 3-methyl-2-oxobutanoate hydroxymethyltransferase [Bordetella sp.]|nr:MAG: 3-methyl-2-oxobutanoate hydroxymethyltransferase [Bordetella sp.]
MIDNQIPVTVNQKIRKTVLYIRKKKGIEKLVALAAYTAPMAKKIDQYVDMILVGDSLGMVLYGLSSTLPVTLDMMIMHASAVVRGSSEAFVVVDLPFGSYQKSPGEAFQAAVQILSHTGAQAVKLEGGSEMAETVYFLTQRGIPVLGHIGLMPQKINIFGNYGVQGIQHNDGQKILDDAISLETAGAFSLVIECTAERISQKITNTLSIPVVGIGASPFCDGQILVLSDILGMGGDQVPRFVKQYAHLGNEIERAVSDYANEVRNGEFPKLENCYDIKKTKEKS